MNTGIYGGSSPGQPFRATWPFLVDPLRQNLVTKSVCQISCKGGISEDVVLFWRSKKEV